MKINIKGIIKKNKDFNVVRESVDYYDKIINILEVPYFKNLETMGIPEDQYETIFSKLYGEPVSNYNEEVYDSNGNQIYYEDSDGFWWKREYDDNENEIYYESHQGEWLRKEYDDNGIIIFYVNSFGEWYKKEYDEDGNRIHYQGNLSPFEG